MRGLLQPAKTIFWVFKEEKRKLSDALDSLSILSLILLITILLVLKIITYLNECRIMGGVQVCYFSKTLIIRDYLALELLIFIPFLDSRIVLRKLRL